MFEGEPDPALAAKLAVADVTRLDGDALVNYLRATHRLLAWVQALQLDAVTELAYRDDHDRRTDTVDEFAAAQLAAALTLSGWSADRLQSTALGLEHLPGTKAALRAGTLDLPRAQVIAEATMSLEEATARAVEDRVLPHAGQQTRAQLDRSLTRAVHALAPVTMVEQAQVAAEDRCTWLTHDGTGASTFAVRGPTHDVLRLHAAVDAVARTLELASGSLDQRRFDACTHVANAILDHPELPSTRFGSPGLVLLTTPGQPAELLGAGPVTDNVAARLIDDPHCRVVPATPAPKPPCQHEHDPGYSVPATTARHVILRDRTCRFPGCRQPAHRCDMDHTTPYPVGPTCACNLGALCRHHHRLKTLGGWKLEQPTPGHFTWTAPTGHHYRVAPDDEDAWPDTG